ncbi:hypothetical protein E4U58_001256 [Claviceps cyperi]|nr:hypothetical protein E4U58_001256 [Claviceps cyperi]
MGICKECMEDNKFRRRNPQLPALWSEANELDLGEPPEHLEALGPLTPLEEWLISRVHTRMQTMHHCLPVPPGQLDIFILRPRNQTDQPNMINQFRAQLRVRRPVVAAWLRHLKANHDGYSDVTSDEDALSQLPDDGNVNAELRRKPSIQRTSGI